MAFPFQGNRMATLDLPTARAQRTVLPTRTKVLCALFFFSGFPALIYQLTWQRELFRIFGWRAVLESYGIDGRPQFDAQNAEHRATLDSLMAIQESAQHTIEDCPDVLARTAGKMPVTDDNMATEWRQFWRPEN
jgi:hypothetical protein